MPQGYQDPLTGEWISTDLDPFSAAFAPNGQAPLSVPGQRINGLPPAASGYTGPSAGPQPSAGAITQPHPGDRPFSQGFGAAGATPMRGPKPTFPYPRISAPDISANGPGAPTNLPMQRPSGVGMRPGDIDTPGGAYGGGSPGPGGGYNDVGYGGGQGSPLSAGGPWRGGGSAGGPPVPTPDGQGAPSPSLMDRFRSVFGGAYDNVHSGVSAVGNMLPDPRTIGAGPAIGPGGALPMGSGMSPAMAPAGDTTRGPGSDANAPLAGGDGVNIPIGGGPGNVMESPTGTPAGGGGRGGGGARGGGGGGAHRGGGSRGGAAPRLAPPPGAAPIVTQPGWGMIDRPNANPGIGGGMLGGAQTGGARGVSADPKMGAFDLSSLFNHPAIAAAAAAHPNVQARIPAPAPAPRTAPRSAIAAPTPATGGPGPIDPSIIAQQKRRLPMTPAGYGDQSWLYGNQPPM